MKKLLGICLIALVVGLWTFAILGDGVLQNVNGTTSLGGGTINGTATTNNGTLTANVPLSGDGGRGVTAATFSDINALAPSPVITNNTTIGYTNTGNIQSATLNATTSITLGSGIPLYMNGTTHQIDGVSTDYQYLGPGSLRFSVMNRSPVGSFTLNKRMALRQVDNDAPESGNTVWQINTNGNFATSGTITATNGFTSYTNSLAVNSFTFPATTVNWTNPVHISIEVYIDNTAVTGTALKKNGTTIYSGLSTDVSIGLRDGEYFSETYTVGTPVGAWSVYP